MTVEAQLVTCGSCGTRFDLSTTALKAWRARGLEPLCHRCRHPVRVDPAEVERLKQWWLARYTLDELLELGEGWTSRRS